MSEENIDDIKITVCILRILFYIIFVFYRVVIKTCILYTLYTHGRENLCENPLYSYIYVIIFFIKKKNVVLIFRYILVLSSINNIFLIIIVHIVYINFRYFPMFFIFTTTSIF